MSFLGRAMAFGARAAAAGSKFLGRATPAISFIGKSLPGALNTAASIAANPFVNQAANRIGVNPNVMRQINRGINNVQAGAALVPGVVGQVRGAVEQAKAVSAPVRQSLGQLYRNTLA